MRCPPAGQPDTLRVNTHMPGWNEREIPPTGFCFWSNPQSSGPTWACGPSRAGVSPPNSGEGMAHPARFFLRPAATTRSYRGKGVAIGTVGAGCSHSGCDRRQPEPLAPQLTACQSKWQQLLQLLTLLVPCSPAGVMREVDVAYNYTECVPPAPRARPM
jgi:hypothetical protein